jgi:hypothetical protein
MMLRKSFGHGKLKKIAKRKDINAKLPMIIRK